ncbi:RICIN domain-containing protein [Kitasatospora aureofaciens]|uniref:RICIN domain-containing protein n=1 Tax=Kitasatospora aureofaciens TaxID=1894 RepID=UPI001C492277|nr:RICIN domain-containing protein [Kitasatospora aureofaciens]MBV6702807.1 RICIN domain-containing protein [Kitasatospora aureofaciens]
MSAYANTCSADSRAAQELANEAWQRAVEACGPGSDPAPSRLHLLAEVTRTAAEWADTGRGSTLSPAFTAWLADLPRPGDGAASARAALTAAEADSLILSAFESLPAARQEDLWQRLDDTTGSPAPCTDSPVGRRLQDACLQAYASRAPQRSCRHLAARLGDHVRHAGSGEADDLDRHLAKCESCQSLRADLDAIRTWQRPALLKALVLWDAGSSPSAMALAPEQEPQDPTPIDPKSDDPNPGTHDRNRRLPRAARTDGRTGWRLLIPLAAAGAGALAALAIAGLLLTTVERAGEHPQPVDAPTLPAPGRSLPTNGSDDAPPEIGPAAMSSLPPTASASAAVPTSTPPSPTRPVTAMPTNTTPSPTQPVAAGLPLVNHGSELCVGLTTAAQTAGPLQLQPCNGQATQRWQRLPAGQDTYQLRNTGTGTCLDGTTTGGNSVTVTLTACRSDTAEQLWRFAPDAQAAAFRLLFVPPVPSSDYPAHLLGPQDWTKANPPHPGSLLMHLPNYYNSDSFLFTMG